MKWDPDNADPNVGSFMPVLRWVCAHHEGAVLELGGGYFSTPFLEDLWLQGRPVATYEFDAEWEHELRARFKHFVTSHFSEVARKFWGVVLIDCEGWSRQPYFEALRWNADVFVIHDSQDPWIDRELFHGFRYIRDYGENPQTTVVSDVLDVREIP